MRSEHTRGRARYSPRISRLTLPQKYKSSQIVHPILNFPAKSTSNCSKCPTLSRSFCPCFFCFHTHSGFQRHLLTSFLIDPSLVVTFNWNGIFTIERRPDSCRLGMGSAFSSLDACLPINYTHGTRLCQEKNEATVRRPCGPNRTGVGPRALVIRTTGGFDTPTVEEGRRSEPQISPGAQT
jgi:hypothetical protein